MTVQNGKLTLSCHSRESGNLRIISGAWIPDQVGDDKQTCRFDFLIFHLKHVFF